MKLFTRLLLVKLLFLVLGAGAAADDFIDLRWPALEGEEFEVEVSRGRPKTSCTGRR
jgi:hypothetical protein